jgi:phage terminase large subunit-like protein
MAIRRPVRTLGPGVSNFFAANYRFPEGSKKGEPFYVDPFQEDILDLIYEIDERGERQWRFIVVGIPRGNGKSPLCGGIADFELAERQDSPNIFCAAASREQAGIVHRFAYDLPQGGPMEDFIEFPRVKDALGPLKMPYNDGVLKVLSADGNLQHGKNPSVVIEDELHAFTTGKQQELHFALTTALHKRSDSVMIIITTAGADKASLLGELYDSMLQTHELEYSDDGCLMVGRDYESKSLLIWYGAPEDADVSDPAVWRACNPASWISDESLLLAARREPESVFRRLYLNQWVRGADAAIQPGAWDACLLDGDIEPGADVWLGVDVGEKHDPSSIVMVSPQGDRLRMKAFVFDPEEHNVKTLLPILEAKIREIADEYNLRGLGYDPWQFRRSAELLEADGIRAIEYPQNDSHMVPASQLFYELIMQEVIAHDGEKILRKHMLAAAAKQTSRGAWRIEKPLQRGSHRTDSHKKVDAAVAGAIACAVWSQDEKAGGDLWASSW